jgi:hypothetical protein
MRPYKRMRDALQPEDLDYADALARRASRGGTRPVDRMLRALLDPDELRGVDERAPQAAGPAPAERPPSSSRGFKSAA